MVHQDMVLKWRCCACWVALAALTGCGIDLRGKYTAMLWLYKCFAIYT